ncbi:MAG: TOBE domain-containing protein, partial [Pseudomonadota bacterium]
QVQQIGTAHEIYEHPRNRFVADFIGETNLFDVTIDSLDESRARCQLADGKALEAQHTGRVNAGSAGHVSIRPEQLFLHPPGQDALMEGIVERLIYLGTDLQHLVRLASGQSILVRTQSGTKHPHEFKPGDPVGVRVNDGAARLLVD